MAKNIKPLNREDTLFLQKMDVTLNDLFKKVELNINVLANKVGYITITEHLQDVTFQFYNNPTKGNSISYMRGLSQAGRYVAMHLADGVHKDEISDTLSFMKGKLALIFSDNPEKQVHTDRLETEKNLNSDSYKNR